MTNTSIKSPDTSNNTLLLSAAAVVPLATYTLLITLLGLLGNTLVVYSSIRYNAIQLDKVSVLFVQNLAVADLIYIFCNVLPSAITYLTRRYVLGRPYCFANAVLTFIPGSVNTLTILALTAYRLLIVISPYRAISRARARVIVGLTWLLALGPVVIALAYRSNSVFVRTYAACVSDVYERKEAAVVVTLCLGTIIVLPVLGTTVINAILCAISISLKKAARQRREAKELVQNGSDPPDTGREGGGVTGLLNQLRSGSLVPPTKQKKKNSPLLTVCLLSGCFVLSWTPYIVYVLWKTKDPDVSPLLELFAFHAIQLNSVCNPILYTMTNRRFGRYVKQLVSGLLPGRFHGNRSLKWVVSVTGNSATYNGSPASGL
ncbi:hypothetical protein ACHWQZ_G017714 [Mnemiopsis leidyi]